MASRGRPRKAGKRTKAGRLVVMPDRGTDRTQERCDEFAGHQGSAIGRAYAKGLLGAFGSDEAKDRLEAANRLAACRALVYGRRGYRCTLDQSVRGGGGDESEAAIERKVNARHWLAVAEAAMGPGGFRAWELADGNYADAGPPWLDALLAGKAGVACDRALQSALKALDAIAPVRRAMVVAC